jgi:hypothetical protein
VTDYWLAKGAHRTPEEGRCAMEFVAYIAGEPHSDRPVCVDEPLRAMGIGLNDCLPDDRRQALRPLLARCIGTAGDGMTERRRYMALDWLIRTYTPTWLAAAGVHEHADRLRALGEVADGAGIRMSQPVLNAAWAAAGAAAGAAAWGAAGDAAWAAAGDAAWGAAGDAAGAAARAAARAAAGDAARAAAWAALAPTVAVLQDSAVELFDRMLPTVAIPMPVDVQARASEVLAA